jgi:signal transduction histidine kinase
MASDEKTKAELVHELDALRQQLAALEKVNTERQKCETDLASFAKLPSEDPYPVLRIAQDGVLLYANAASTPLLLDWGCHVGQETPPEWRNLAATVLGAGLRENVEVEHKDRIFSFVVVPIKETAYVNLYGRDITEQKEAEQKLIAAYTQVQETQAQLIQAEKLEAVGRIASGVAHEVKNPLGILMLGVNYLEQRLPEAEGDIAKTIQTLKNNIRRADYIIQAMLDFSRATALYPEPHDINAIVESALHLVQHSVQMVNITVEKNLKTAMPHVVADKTKIEQVFVNILLNALQAMPEGGGLSVRSHLRRIDKPQYGLERRTVDHIQPGETVVAVEIKDEGVGIPDEDLQKIFDPFFSTKGPHKGTGLGLSVTKNIIDLHKGLIEVKSKVGKGTQVTVMFKVVKEKE